MEVQDAMDQAQLAVIAVSVVVLIISLWIGCVVSTSISSAGFYEMGQLRRKWRKQVTACCLLAGVGLPGVIIPVWTNYTGNEMLWPRICLVAVLAAGTAARLVLRFRPFAPPVG